MYDAVKKENTNIEIEDFKEKEVEIEEPVFEKVQEIPLEEEASITKEIPDILEGDCHEEFARSVSYEEEFSHSDNTEQSAVIAPVQRADNVPPQYPRLARRFGYEGLVILIAAVSEEGTCLKVGIKKSSGYTILDRAAAKAVCAWEFKPAERKGVPVQGEIEIQVRFRLTDKAV